MHGSLSTAEGLLAVDLTAWLVNTGMFLKVLVGFSIIIFVHELGHFLAAKWVGVRVDRFAVGFGYRLFGWRSGEGLTFGNRPNYRAGELVEKNYGETDYCFKALPLGGYVKMLGQDDIVIDDKTGEVQMTDDPRAFTNRTVGQRMIIVSAGVVFNLLFAAVLFTLVFMIGREMQPPIVGAVIADSPAAEAGLMADDRVVEINGKPAKTFRDIAMLQYFDHGEAHLRVERDGRVLDELLILRPDWNERAGLFNLGIAPKQTTVLAADADSAGDLEAPKAMDEITHVDGQAVSDPLEIMLAFLRSGGRPLELTLERPDPDDPDAPRQTIRVFQRANIQVAPVAAAQAGAESRHILGFLRRQQVTGVKKRTPAARAGFKAGDVIAQWGRVASPLYSDISTSIRANAGRKIEVVVEREGRRVTLTVTPSRPPLKLIGDKTPRIGVYFLHLEEDKPLVAHVAPGTPAAALNMPRGSLILEVDGHAVANWFDVIERLKDAAGRAVDVLYRSGSDEIRGRMPVPSSIVNELDLPPGAFIISIERQKKAALSKGKEVRLLTTPELRKLLEANVGHTVSVTYSADPTAQEKTTKAFVVRPDNLDAWQLRIAYLYDAGYRPKTELVRYSNPITACAAGVKFAVFKVREVYGMLSQLAGRKVSVEHVSGPVGIFGAAMQQAKAGYSDLFFFLAFLSVNLAVINFLPLPVMDGGLMVFLLIEKVKGKPLSLKTQMVTTIVGLAAIILFGLFITIQDISRFFN